MQRSLIPLLTVVVLAASVLGCEPPAKTGSATSPPSAPVALQAPATGDRTEEGPPAGIVIEEPSPTQPVAVGATLRPVKVRPGQTMTLFVQARIAPTWHIYGTEDSASEAIPTTLKLEQAKGIEPVGSWTSPPGKRAAGTPASHYEGTVTFQHQLRVTAGAAPGPLEVTCEFGYQACDPFRCQLPAKLVLKARAEVFTQD
jgi:hypothetical protein